MAKDVQILSNTIDANDTKQIVLNQSEINRVLPWTFGDAMVLIRFSINGTQNLSAAAIQIGFTASTEVGRMENANGGGTIGHMWRGFIRAGATYNSGTPDYWANGNDNAIGSRVVNGSATDVTFQYANADRWANGDDSRQIFGFRMISSGPVDATTNASPIFREGGTTGADVDDDAWAQAQEGVFPSGYFSHGTNQTARDDTTHGVLDTAFVYFNDATNTANDLVIHDFSVTKFS